MAGKSRWEKRKVKCSETKREANLLIEWRKEKGKEIPNSISCDNPRLSDLDNWDCRWTCMEEIEKKLKAK